MSSILSLLLCIQICSQGILNMICYFIYLSINFFCKENWFYFTNWISFQFKSLYIYIYKTSVYDYYIRYKYTNTHETLFLHSKIKTNFVLMIEGTLALRIASDVYPHRKSFMHHCLCCTYAQKTLAGNKLLMVENEPKHLFA